MRRILGLLAVVILFGGCATEVSLRKVTFSGFTDGRLEGGQIYYAEASGSINTGAIIYKNEKPDSYGREIVVIASGVTKPFWQDVLLALIGAGGRVAAAGVYGLSIDAARMVVNQANSQAGGSATASGGQGGGGGVGIGGDSSATGGTATSTTAPVTATGGTSSATTGAINNDNTAVTGSSSSRSCSTGTTSSSTVCP